MVIKARKNRVCKKMQGIRSPKRRPRRNVRCGPGAQRKVRTVVEPACSGGPFPAGRRSPKCPVRDPEEIARERRRLSREAEDLSAEAPAEFSGTGYGSEADGPGDRPRSIRSPKRRARRNVRCGPGAQRKVRTVVEPARSGGPFPAGRRSPKCPVRDPEEIARVSRPGSPGRPRIPRHRASEAVCLRVRKRSGRSQ